MPKKINYGTKHLVKENKNVAIRPVFVLIKEDGGLDKKCFCAECQSVFDFTPDPNTSFSRYDTVRDLVNIAPNVTCPDCGNNAHISYVRAQTSDEKIGHIKLHGAYRIPDFVTGRYLFDYTDDDNNVTRVDDNIMVRSTIVYPSGKTFNSDTEYSITSDFIKNTQLVTKTKINGDKREEVSVKDMVDTFRYISPSKSFAVNDAYNIISAHVAGRAIYSEILSTQYNPIIESEIIQKRQNNTVVHKNEDGTFSGYSYGNTSVNNYLFNTNSHTLDAINANKEFTTETAKLITSRFKNVDPVYIDTFNNGLFLAEHHPGSTEEDTPIDENKRILYTYMMTKYPVAFEYACQRADNRCMDFTMNEKRRHETNPDYEPKEIPNSVKSKFLREEVQFVSEQLSAVDDKILDTVQSSSDVNDMKQKLQFFVFGKDKLPDTLVPKDVRLQEDGSTMQNPIDATKKLKNNFRLNMIGVANTVYTCHKVGIKDINHVNTLIDIANDSPSLLPERHRRNGSYFYKQPSRDMYRHAQTIAPLRDKNQLQFLKSYANTHTPTEFIDAVYGSNKNWSQAMENVRIYKDIRKNANIAISQEDVEQVVNNLAKDRLAEYLQHKSLKDAYVDYVMIYDNKTVKKVNLLANEIQSDRNLAVMKKSFDEGGLDALKETISSNPKYAGFVEHFPPYCDNTPEAKSQFAANRDEYLVSFFTKYVSNESTDQKEFLVPQDGKALFKNRNMKDLHDELSHMATNAQYPNHKLEYSDEEKAFEAVYDAPDESGKWSFSLHKDTNEMIRTATELSNCLASHQDYAINKRHTYLFMCNELGEKVACISLKKSYGDNKYSVIEFQGAHDNAVEGRYKDVIMQWLNEKEIDYAHNSNVAAIGTNVSFYGNRDADYHHQEIDETTGTVISATDNQKRIQERIDRAKNIYGIDENGNINVPNPPDYLSEFN